MKKGEENLLLEEDKADERIASSLFPWFFLCLLSLKLDKADKAQSQRQYVHKVMDSSLIYMHLIYHIFSPNSLHFLQVSSLPAVSTTGPYPPRECSLIDI